MNLRDSDRRLRESYERVLIGQARAALAYDKFVVQQRGWDWDVPADFWRDRANMETQYYVDQVDLLLESLIEFPVSYLTKDLLALHSRNKRNECDGCDFQGWEAEPPEWPCRTVKLIIGKEFHPATPPKKYFHGRLQESGYIEIPIRGELT